MAAPLPNGLDLRVMPQAPTANPKDFATDVQGAFAAAHSGLVFGQELANLENLQAERELKSKQIKADKAKNDLELAMLGHASEQLPLLKQQYDSDLQAKIAASKAAASSSVLSGATADALFAGGAPQKTADLSLLGISNQTNTAQANQELSKLSTPEQAAVTAGATAKAQAFGNLGFDYTPGSTPSPDGTNLRPNNPLQGGKLNWLLKSYNIDFPTSGSPVADQMMAQQRLGQAVASSNALRTQLDQFQASHGLTDYSALTFDGTSTGLIDPKKAREVLLDAKENDPTNPAGYRVPQADADKAQEIVKTLGLIQGAIDPQGFFADHKDPTLAQKLFDNMPDSADRTSFCGPT